MPVREMRKVFWAQGKISLTFYNGEFCRLTSTSARIKADRARQALGWNPTRGEDEFLEEIEDVVMTMSQQGEGE
jgi:nucleoside-diphosphate-sugar epimerase